MFLGMEVKFDFDSYVELIIPWLLLHGVRIVIIIIGALILNKVISKFISKAVRIAIVPDPLSPDSEQKREDTLISIFGATATIVIFAVAILMVLQEIGMAIGPVLAAAGIVGLAFGFGGQYLIRDVITGLFIIIENQYRIGDVVKINSADGVVEKVTLRMTRLRNLDGTVHHIPNGEITLVSNLSKDYARVNLDIGVGYGSEIEKVIEVVNRVGNELAADPLFSAMIIKAPQFLRVNELGDSAIVIKVLGETIPLQQWAITGELRKRIIVAFNNEGIEIPFPQRVVHHKNILSGNLEEN